MTDTLKPLPWYIRKSLSGRWASFSKCGQYRYALSIQIAPGDSAVTFVMLNPSTATEMEDDPTIRRCIGYARNWGFSVLNIVNLFAWRATDPKDLKRATDPIGPANDWWLKWAASQGLIIGGWGANGSLMGRANQVKKSLPNLRYLRLTKDGQPSHPLYLPKGLTPQAWNTRADARDGGE